MDAGLTLALLYQQKLLAYLVLTGCWLILSMAPGMWHDVSATSGLSGYTSTPIVRIDMLQDPRFNEYSTPVRQGSCFHKSKS